jgi:hypothetical protein
VRPRTTNFLVQLLQALGFFCWALLGLVATALWIPCLVVWLAGAWLMIRVRLAELLEDVKELAAALAVPALNLLAVTLRGINRLFGLKANRHSRRRS